MTPVDRLDDAVATLPPSILLDSKTVDQLNVDTFEVLAEAALADDLLSVAEEHSLLNAATALGVDSTRLASGFPDILDRLAVTRVNDGRIPTLDDGPLPLKRGETAHAIVAGQLLKEVAVREYRGGYSGFSFQIVKGVRYHVGSTRDRSVVVGTQVEVADTGLLEVTSHRAVFLGSKRSLEFAYPKLLDITPYSDGIRLAVSNRQTPSVFKIPHGSQAVAAIITAAAAALLE